MSAQANHFRIGLFILAALAIAVAGLVILSAGRLFEHTVTMETYFDESVQGLTVGAPVKHRGVQVGTVTDIHFADDEYDLDAADERLFRYRRYVVVKSAIRDHFPGMSEGNLQGLLAQASTKGLRVRLATQGVTGVVHIEADYVDPDEFPPLPIAWTPHDIYVPSAPSTVMVVSTALGNIARDLEKASIHQITKDIDALVVAMTKMVNESQVERVSRQATEALGELRGTLQQARKVLENPDIADAVSEAAAAAGSTRRAAADLALTSKQVRQATEGLPETIARLDRTARRVERLVASRSSDIEDILDNLRQVSENLQDVTSNAKRYPAQVLLGDPPPRREAGRP